MYHSYTIVLAKRVKHRGNQVVEEIAAIWYNLPLADSLVQQENTITRVQFSGNLVVM